MTEKWLIAPGEERVIDIACADKTRGARLATDTAAYAIKVS